MWNRIGLSIGCASLAVLTGCTSITERLDKLEAENAKTRKEMSGSIAERLGKLEAGNVQNRKEIATLKGGDTIKLTDLFEVYWDGNYGRINSVLVNRYLDKIELPENPKPRDIDAYLAKLYRLRRFNNDSSFNDQITAKVSQIGAENLVKLLPYLDYSPFSQAFIGLGGGEKKELLHRALIQKQNNNYQLSNLYVKVADASDTDFILEQLPQAPLLIEAVTKLRLEKKALPVLKKRLLDSSSGNFNYSDRWLAVVLETITPEEKEAFLKSYWNKNQRSSARNGNDWQLRECAARLAPFGYIPAFLYMTDAAMRQDTNNYLRRAMGLTPCTTMEEFAVWYRKNRDHLTFDQKQGIYIPAAEKPAPKVVKPAPKVENAAPKVENATPKVVNATPKVEKTATKAEKPVVKTK